MIWFNADFMVISGAKHCDFTWILMLQAAKGVLNGNSTSQSVLILGWRLGKFDVANGVRPCEPNGLFMEWRFGMEYSGNIKATKKGIAFNYCDQLEHCGDTEDWYSFQNNRIYINIMWRINKIQWGHWQSLQLTVWPILTSSAGSERVILQPDVWP